MTQQPPKGKPRKTASNFTAPPIRLCNLRVSPKMAQALWDKANSLGVSQSVFRRQALAKALKMTKGEV